MFRLNGLRLYGVCQGNQLNRLSRRERRKSGWLLRHCGLMLDGGGGRGEFFGKDEAGGRGLGLACETDADGVVQQRLERELSAVDLQCHGAGSRGWRGAQAGEREAAG